MRYVQVTARVDGLGDVNGLPAANSDVLDNALVVIPTDGLTLIELRRGTAVIRPDCPTVLVRESPDEISRRIRRAYNMSDGTTLLIGGSG